ncbi:DEAD/DEAH box helicase [Flavobacterium sp. LHD-80]|uniref:DEAD/DEAH box helicase n=1 Tax=Flavobacterium sp. LHD-80 TaxID=3071411 RepID=UPI0027E1BC45|nr:DEAD/DEAH box helicase [Flavobacterium sp. LHD-80]MDQ6471398.1 DEAD/DEAH box helicase [Flavobacterium sp. LHD-80]
MLTEEKRTLTDIIKKNSEFSNLLMKLTTNINLEDNEKSFILTAALMFLKEYDINKKFKTYAEIAYSLILKYSITYSDYKPLYDFATLFGFYPISKVILENDLLETNTLNDFFVSIQLQEFLNKSEKNIYTETYEQYKERNNFLEDNCNEKGFLAPTSYGKSSVIIDYINKLDNNNKIVIVVPTKSLLMQTYKMVRDADLGYKILIHEEMYINEKKFIAVFTQERALRLLKRRKDIYFDVLIIDEAHNIFKKVKSEDNRSLLLSRLLRINKKLNNNQKVVYLSPLINKIDNLKFDNKQNINSHTINFNIKSPELFEFRTDHKIVKHNKYFINKSNTGFEIGTSTDFIRYIVDNSAFKNFLYYNSPRIIEKLALRLSKNVEEINDFRNVSEIIETLKEEVHGSFYGIDLLNYGIIYLHGKLPDLIKEYLEHKFKTLPELKYVIANSVILEGINLPIDTLFILNTYGLRGKELTNLIGRVNRLNEIFKGGNNLSKLLPKIHFVNNKFENKDNTKMFSKILELRNRMFDDKIENPTLENFNIEKEKESDKINILKVIKDEDFLIDEHTNDQFRLKQYLIENGINLFYSDSDKLTEKLFTKLKGIDANSEDWQATKLLDKIFKIFIEDFVDDDKFIIDFEFFRLQQQVARDFYDVYIENRKYSLKQNINKLHQYLKGRRESNDKKHHIYYIGETYGELPYKSSTYFRDIYNKNVAIDLTEKNDKELINYAIVKLKIEDDFISFKLNKFIVFLYDYELISEDIYNKYIYGTVDKEVISFSKFGLNISLISRLRKDNQMINLSFDSSNNLMANNDFKLYLSTLNDFKRFEIERFIS